MKKILLSLMAVFACVSMHADEWSINFAEIGDANGLADKAGASIGAAVDNGMGNVTLGEPLNTNFGIQTGTSWIYRTAQKALYQSNSGGRNFGVFNAKKKQVITLEISAAPTPTNATLKSTNGNVRTYEVTADGTVTFNLARYNYIYSIAVSNPSSSEVEYTVKYVDADGKELKESTKNSGEPGAAIVVGEVEKAGFVADGVKYIYVSDDSEGKTIAADGSSVVTLVFRQAASYVVNAKFNGNVISTANVFEGDNAAVFVPYYQLVEGVLYNTPKVDKGSLSYGQVTLSNVNADADINVTYTEDATQNAVFYAEGENIATCTPAKDGYTEIRMSNGAAGYANNSVITTLEPGVYTLTTATRSGITNFTVNGVNVYTLTSTGAVVTETSAEFTVKGTSELIATCDKTTSYFDYVLIRKVGEAPKNTIAAGKYTLTADVALAEDVTEAMVPADFKKYIGTYKSNATLAGDENSLTISENDENGLFAGFEICGDAVALSADKTITLNGKVFNVRTAADAENGSLAITAEGDNYKMDAANVWYSGQKVATITNIVIAKAAAAPVVAIEKGEGTYTVTSTSETAALYYLCKPMSWLDEGETPESVLLAEIEGMGSMIDSEETWELYDHMGMKPAPKTFTIADYQEMYAGEEMFIIAANVGWDGEKLGVISNIAIEYFTVPAPAPVVAIEKGEGTYTVTSTSETAALYYLCKPTSWLDEGETPESCLRDDIEGMASMIDSEETWEMYGHMGMTPAPKTFTIADYQEMYAGEEMFIIAANVGWDGEKLGVISNIAIETFTVPETTGIKNVTAAKAINAKFIENGKLVIISNGKKFNAAGVEMK